MFPCRLPLSHTRVNLHMSLTVSLTWVSSFGKGVKSLGQIHCPRWLTFQNLSVGLIVLVERRHKDWVMTVLCLRCRAALGELTTGHLKKFSMALKLASSSCVLHQRQRCSSQTCQKSLQNHNTLFILCFDLISYFKKWRLLTYLEIFFQFQPYFS